MMSCVMDVAFAALLLIPIAVGHGEVPCAVPAADAAPVEAAAIPVPDEPAAPAAPFLISESFVGAIVMIESAGDPSTVGAAGERGLMQIKRETWREASCRSFGREISFERAFEPETNMRVGIAYLEHLQVFLDAHRDSWLADERSLLLACYNAGPTRVKEAGFDIRQLPEKTRCYVERACALDDFYGIHPPVQQRVELVLSAAGTALANL